jgi:hypothetical protein
MPGFDFTSRMSLPATRLNSTLAAAALLIFAGATASPSSRAGAVDKTMNWESVRMIGAS